MTDILEGENHMTYSTEGGRRVKTIICPDCGGLTEVCVKHPSLGTRDCPEAYINIPCPACEGTGEIDEDEEDI